MSVEMPRRTRFTLHLLMINNCDNIVIVRIWTYASIRPAGPAPAMTTVAWASGTASEKPWSWSALGAMTVCE